MYYVGSKNKIEYNVEKRKKSAKYEIRKLQKILKNEYFFIDLNVKIW